MSSSGRFLFAAACAALASACGGGGGFADAAVDEGPPPPGSFSLAWSLTDMDGNTITCDSVGAQAVTVTLTSPDFQGGRTEVFGCASGEGQASEPVGDYRANFELAGPTGILATSPQQTFTIRSGANTALTPTPFEVQNTGNIALSLTANKPAPPAAALNCAPTASGGAAITTMKITLERTTNTACVPVTFAVSAGSQGGTAGTYTVNCGAPATITCLQADQQLTVSNVPSGNHQIHVRGATGVANECYVNDDTFSVPPVGATVTRALNLTLNTNSPSC